MTLISARISRLTLLAGFLACASACHSPKSSPSLSGSDIARGNVTQNTKLARTETDQAFALIQKGDYAGAEAALQRAVALDPMYGPAQNDLGLVEFHSDRLYDAAWHFENAAKLMPHQPEPVNNAGLVLERAGKLTDAEKAFVAAYTMDQQSPDYAANLARVRVRAGKLDDYTRQLLDYVAYRDQRPEWVDWARINSIHIRSLLQNAAQPTTFPAAQ